MLKYVNRVFVGAKLDLDENEFEACSFKGCIMVYHGHKEPYEAVPYGTYDDCVFQFVGPAERTLHYLGLLGKHFPEALESVIDSIRNDKRGGVPLEERFKDLPQA